MAETTVFGCDWCGAIVPTSKIDGKPMFGAHVTAKVGPSVKPDEYDICRGCLQAFRAVSQGKFRR